MCDRDKRFFIAIPSACALYTRDASSFLRPWNVENYAGALNYFHFYFFFVLPDRSPSRCPRANSVTDRQARAKIVVLSDKRRKFRWKIKVPFTSASRHTIFCAVTTFPKADGNSPYGHVNTHKTAASVSNVRKIIVRTHYPCFDTFLHILRRTLFVCATNCFFRVSINTHCMTINTRV